MFYLLILGASNAVNTQPKGDFIEQVICNESDIKENEMKQFEMGDEGKVLVVKQNGKISAMGTKCSHYGAMLSTGALGAGRIRCPWHGACFNIETGDIEDFPGQDSIPTYKVCIEAGKVKVRANKLELKTNKRIKAMAKRDRKNTMTFVVVGGGPSGAICAETLRQEGFTGRIVLVCKEPYLPYDRIKLSKAMSVEVNTIQLRKAEFYDENDIETMLDVEATNIDCAKKSISLSNGYEIMYDKVYIATGSSPRKLPEMSDDMKNIFVLRNHFDAHTIHNLLKPESRVVILGVSFIGLEVAAYCSDKVAKVTVIGRDNVPLKPIFGAELGARIMELCKEKKIEFEMNTGISKILVEGNTVNGVELTNGKTLESDVCVIGIGSTLNTEFAKGSGITINANGSIDTNQYLQSNDPNIYIGGDIANAPVFSIENKLATIGHYPLAQYHGHIAGKNMAGITTELKAVPFFWCMIFGKSFRYSGYGAADEIQIEGDLKELKFVAYHMNKDGKVIAISSCQRDPIVSQFAEFTSQGKALYKKDLSPDPFAWSK